ncbi:MAG: outer membrane beta-barrel protein, partial [Legionellales bacterium]|nr:outer membrane beta-barrel protein [Legionellales bacterium]
EANSKLFNENKNQFLPITLFLQLKNQLSTDPNDKTDVDNGNLGARAYLGYQFNKYLSLESGYTQYSHTDVNNIDGVRGADLSLYQGAIDAVAKVSLPLTQKINIYAKGGAAYVMTQGVDSSVYVNVQPNQINANLDYGTKNIDEFRPTYAVGVSYDLTQHLSTDVSWSQIVGGNDIATSNFASLGLSYHF